LGVAGRCETSGGVRWVGLAEVPPDEEKKEKMDYLTLSDLPMVN
jgi:hypothetical protein